MMFFRICSDVVGRGKKRELENSELQQEKEMIRGAILKHTHNRQHNQYKKAYQKDFHISTFSIAQESRHSYLILATTSDAPNITHDVPID